jgi:hypothetical protein
VNAAEVIETNVESRLPAVRRPSDLQDIARMGQWLAAAESESQHPDALGAAAALRLAFARELGLPLTAAAELSVIRGRLFLGALLLRALAERAGFRVVRVEGDDSSCTAAVLDAGGEELGRSTYTIERAQRAGLIKDRGGWVKNPDRMLWARAATEAIRDYAPEVAVGLGVIEELDEYGVEDEQPPPPASEPQSFAPDPPDLVEPERQQEDEHDALATDDPPATRADDEPMSDAQRRKVFAVVRELDKRFAPPKRQDGSQAADWKTILVDSVEHYFSKEVKQLSKREASWMIERMNARLAREEELAAQGEAAGDSQASDDIPF